MRKGAVWPPFFASVFDAGDDSGLVELSVFGELESVGVGLFDVAGLYDDGLSSESVVATDVADCGFPRFVDFFHVLAPWPRCRY